MLFVAIILPIAVYLAGLTSTFYLAYLLFVEALIFIAIIRKMNGTKLTFSCNNNRLKFNCGLFGKESLLFCDKVVLVHTEKMEEEMDIIIITSVNFRNKFLKPVQYNIQKKYPKLEEEYLRIKRKNPETSYYYQVIRKGALKKYLLLDIIYKNCVKAVYTNECIQNIKISRGQTLV